jgi:hypothetical protein
MDFLKRTLKIVSIFLITLITFYVFNDSFIALLNYLPTNEIKHNNILNYYTKSFLVHLGLYTLYVFITFIIIILGKTILKLKQ